MCPADASRARSRADEIRGHLERAWDLLAAAYREGDYLELGYSTWAEYVVGEFPIRPQLTRGDRPDVFAELKAAGMSNRDIAAATGLGYGTVARSISDPIGSEVDLDWVEYPRPALTKRNLARFGITGVHPAAECFPNIVGEDYQWFARSIAEHGFVYPIAVNLDGILIDGRQRVAVGLALGIEPPMRRMAFVDEVGFIVSLNIVRRHIAAPGEA